MEKAGQSTFTSSGTASGDAASLVAAFLDDPAQPLPAIADADPNQFELLWKRSIARILGLHSETAYVPPNFAGVIID